MKIKLKGFVFRAKSENRNEAIAELEDWIKQEIYLNEQCDIYSKWESRNNYLQEISRKLKWYKAGKPDPMVELGK